jgi:diguanylate cyclase (GGDEF)-like protein
MRTAAALLLALTLLTGAGAVRAAEPSGDGRDATLQAEMERLYALRSVDPKAFIAQTRSLASLPPPSNVAQREYLQFLKANRAAFEGRFADAVALAKPLGESAEEPNLRLRAATLVVNLRAGTREFEAGLRELDRLLVTHTEASGELRDEIRNLWGTAAVFYAELEKPELSAWYAQRMLGADPEPRQICAGMHFVARAREATKDTTLSADDFNAADEACRKAGDTVIVGLGALSQARFLRDRNRLDDALALMEDRLGAIESTRYPRLVAEAYALDAELLLAAERLDDAERQARHAVDVAKATPTSLPVAMAEKVLYEIARRRRGAAAALGHLQRHLAAERALAEESRIKAMAFNAVRHEALKAEQTLQLTTERNRVLDLEARVAKAESRNAVLLVALVLTSLLALTVWAWRARREARRVQALSRIDALTGAASRQHFSALADVALARGRRSGEPLMLVAFDLDHFKRINDHHGHLAGDALLRAVGEAMRGTPAAAHAACIGRIGGEEFAVLLERAGPAEAMACAEALRAAIAGARARTDGGIELRVTASFGLSGTAECGYDLARLIDVADRALYRAKGAGRDRVIVADRAVDLEAA